MFFTDISFSVPSAPSETYTIDKLEDNGLKIQMKPSGV